MVCTRQSILNQYTQLGLSGLVTVYNEWSSSLYETPLLCELEKFAWWGASELFRLDEAPKSEIHFMGSYLLHRWDSV